MVKNCSVTGCKNTWQPNSNITYHAFPLQDEKRLAQWISVTQLKNIKITCTKYICSAHFTTQSFEEHCAIKRLKKDAVPSIFKDTFQAIDNVPRREDTLHDFHNVPEISMDVLNQDMNVETSTVTEKRTVSVQTPVKYLQDCEEVLRLRREVQLLQQKLKRRDTRIVNTQQLISQQKDNCEDNYENLYNVLKEHVNEFSSELFRNEFENATKHVNRASYSSVIRNFAFTVYFYSPKAYNFLRTKLHLPRPATLRKSLSTYNCNVGFISEIFEFLRNNKEKQYLQDVALMFDCMAIRSQAIYDKSSDKHWGYVDLEETAIDGTNKIATEALVFLIVYN